MALNWMYKNSLTRYSDSASFMPDRSITREEASRFMTEFAERIMKKQPVNIFNCNFFDAYSFDYTLKDRIYRSCQLGIFK